MDTLNADGIWRLFCQTGDPALFVMMKRTEREEGSQKPPEEPEQQTNEIIM